MDQGIKTPALGGFSALPANGTAAAERRTGVEIEFGGLPPEEAATIVAQVLGGELHETSPATWELTATQIGAVKVYLDTAMAPEDHSWLAEIGVVLGAKVIPMEIVTEPIAASELKALDRLIDALRALGGKGSRASLIYGFGLHLNPALADPDGGMDLPKIATAYALLEQWLRLRDPVDVSRRLLPFVEPFPDAFVQELAHGKGGLDLAATFDAIDDHIVSRNHGLDLLPAYAALAPERFQSHPAAKTNVSARPAYHYRLPETRLGVASWSLHYEWTRWQLIEAVAADRPTLEALSDIWLQQHNAALPSEGAFAAAVGATLGERAQMAPDGGPAGQRA
ncbi:MAG: amidoligase family protein [Pseudomonadota bacterium]